MVHCGAVPVPSPDKGGGLVAGRKIDEWNPMTGE